MNRRVVPRASRPCEHADRHTGETPVPLLRYAGSWSQCIRKKRKGALHEPATQIRMTNDQIRKNDKIQMTTPASAPRRTFRHSDFGFLSSFVIRYLSFGRSGSGSQCMREGERRLSM